MSKKSKVSQNNLMYIGSIVLGVVAILLIFATSLTITGSLSTLGLSESTSYSGINVVFGYASNDVTYLAFSFMNLLSYILVLVAIVLNILKLCGVAKSKIVDYLSIALYVVAGVFFFLTTQFTVLSDGLSSAIDIANAVKTTVTLGLGVGAIISGILSILSAVLVLLTIVLKPNKSK